MWVLDVKVLSGLGCLGIGRLREGSLFQGSESSVDVRCGWIDDHNER